MIKFSKYFNYGRFLISLFAIWLCLSTEKGLFFILAGVFSSLITFFVCSHFKIFIRADSVFHIGFLRYSFTLFRYIIQSSYHLISKIINENDKFKSGFVKINVSYLSIREKVLFANIITMTPGTFVVNVQNSVFLVHSVNLDEMKSLNTEKVMKLIKNAK